MALRRPGLTRKCLHSAPVGAMVARADLALTGLPHDPISQPLPPRRAGAACAAAAAQAHPHVWVTMKSEVVYAPDGTATGVRHAWTFDDMFSTFATQGLASKEKGKFTREELAPLAEVNVTSLKEFDYFTQARGERQEGRAERAGRLLSGVRERAAHAALHLAVQDAGEGAEPRSSRSMTAPISSTSPSPRRSRCASSARPQACKLAVARPGEAIVGEQAGRGVLQQPDAVEAISARSSPTRSR